MIDRIVEFSAANRMAVICLTILACVAGWLSMRAVPIDAIPDLSETQVIIVSHWDRSPTMIEDQITYPIVSALTGAPRVKTVRGISDFGESFVYVVFDEGTDIYWARARTQEYLSAVLPSLPPGVATKLGPDATSLGWIFQYAVVDAKGQRDAAELRSIQDFYIRNHLRSVRGVSEIATVGGFSRQFQVNVDPAKLREYRIDLRQVTDAVRSSNSETGARLLEFGDAEYMVRGIGALTSVADLQTTAVATSPDGTPITLRDIGQVTFGPDLRRGAADIDGQGETVTGIVEMRNGENVADVIDAVKKAIVELTPGLPDGVKILPLYDRSILIHNAIANLLWTIAEVIVTVAIVIFIFLRHAPSAAIPAITIPAALLISFIPFHALDLSANIMSLCGLAIAIGALVDASIVVVEQTHKHLESWQAGDQLGDPERVIVRAVKEVARPSFFALLILAAAFLPVIALGGEEGKLFRPLAITKTLAMVAGALLAITFDPAVRLSLMRLRSLRIGSRFLSTLLPRIALPNLGKENALSKALISIYEPVLRWSLEHRLLVLGTAAAAFLLTLPVALHLGSEFMPPLEEGTLLYMPSMPTGISIAAASRFLQRSDGVIKSFPEVDHVLGKTGRADTATDPAPLSMLETVIVLKPQEQWPTTHRWYTKRAPNFIKPLLRRFWPDHISTEGLIEKLNQALRVPGVSNAWTMPIQGRITMLSTGVRANLGIKVAGSDPARVQTLEDEVAAVLRTVPGARSIYAERDEEGYFVDVRWNRAGLARYGISMQTAEETLASAVGGENLTTVIAGRERYTVNVRYMRDFRSDIEAITRVLIPTATAGRQVPLGEVAAVIKTTGSSMIRDEDGLLTGYVYIDLPSAAAGDFVERAKATVASLRLPAGYSLHWTGEFEAITRARARLILLIPCTLALIATLLWMSTRSLWRTALVLLAVPFSAIGAFWLVALMHYRLSVAVWVGLIALLGVDAETGIFMLLYLDLAHTARQLEGRLSSATELRSAVISGAAHRIRPKFMTVATMFLGLLPILWSAGVGAVTMKHIAAPMIGGLVTSFLLELLIYPLLYELWQERKLPEEAAAPRLESTMTLTS